MKRLTALLLALFTLTALFACGPASPSGDGDPTQSGETAGPADDGNVLTLVSGGEARCRIVRSDTASKDVIAACVTLAAAIGDATGVKPGIGTDWDAEEPDGREILVGKSKREKAASAFSALEKDEYTIFTEGNALLLVGGTDEMTVLAVECFVNDFVKKGTADGLSVPRDVNVKEDRTAFLLKQETKGSTLKKMYSDYNSAFEDTPLLSFDETEIPGHTMSPDVEWSLDTEYEKEGSAALRMELKKDYTDTLLNAFWQRTPDAFRVSVKDRKKATLVLWLFVGDIDMLVCDHDAGYGRQTGQGTFFFRALDKNGQTYCWNHTIMGSGWHEIELTFNVHNGVGESFDYSAITGFGLLFSAKQGTVIELDDLRLREYESDHTPSPAPEGGRLITAGEYDAFDGCVVQEWYGADFDTEDRMEGKSSFRTTGNDSNADYRTIVANLDLPMHYAKDVLVVNVKIDDLKKISGVFIELNEVQDVKEYENSFSVEQLKGYGLKEGEWCELRIPLSDFRQNPGGAAIDDITLHNFRWVITASGSENYVSRIDLVYLTEK